MVRSHNAIGIPSRRKVEKGVLERVNESVEAFHDLSQDRHRLDEGDPDEAICVEPKPVSRA